MRVRVSIANLVPQIRIAGNEGSTPFGIVNQKALEKGRHLISPVGGGALMTEFGRRLLEHSFRAQFLEGMDARFTIEEEDLEEVLQLFEDRDPQVYELDPTREVMEELATKELPFQQTPILTPEEVMRVTLEYVKTMRQVPRQQATSARNLTDMPTHRLFNLFRMTVPPLYFEKITMASAVRVITNKQAELIQQGVPQQTSDGWQIGDNFMW